MVAKYPQTTGKDQQQPEECNQGPGMGLQPKLPQGNGLWNPVGTNLSLSELFPKHLIRDHRFFTPGGSTIITSVLQTILNVHEYNMTMQEAVDAARFHHQWLPDEIRMEPNLFPKEVVLSLEKLGYKINEDHSPIIGKVDGIMVLDDKTLEGGADYRGDDTAVGF